MAQGINPRPGKAGLELEKLERKIVDYLRYYINSLTLVAASMGFLLGGQWVWIGIGSFFFFLFWDWISPQDFAPRNVRNPALADVVLYLHAPLMFLLYATFTWRFSVGLGTEGTLSTGLAMLGSLLSLLWLNAFPNVPFVHEMMHRRHPVPKTLAVILSAFFGDPSRDIAHVTGHHIHFDTLKDGDTAYRGENVYHFMWRSTKQSYIDTYEQEKQRLGKKGLHLWSWQGRLFWNVALVLFIPLVVGIFAGPVAAIIMATSIAISKFLMEALNYLQHYGLVRDTNAPLENRHTWNHLSWLTRVVGLEITNHIDHHKDGYIPYYELKPYADGPQMPNIFACAVLGFFPPLWFRFIQKHLKNWDLNIASPEEQKLAMAANKAAGWPDWLNTIESSANPQVA